MSNEQWWNELIEKRKTEAIGLVKVKDIISQDLYPDNTHFIYELLQNAEDTKATEVSFELFSDKLIFKHNGKRLFSKTDIERITDINNYDAQVEKKELFKSETIGKFGIGFKAVFGYTDTPKIHSGKFHFEIYDLVVPKQIPSLEMNLDETIMVFPFNHTHKVKDKRKIPKIAFDDIKIWLEKIKDNTLLFLTNIRKISYSINGETSYIERDEIDEVRIEITNTKNNIATKWLRFKKKLPRKNELYVSVAFQIDIDRNTKKEYIKPINGQVSIFFPAEKEVSNLRFHIHAPFASTVARDSINELDENDELLSLISKLLLDVLRYVKLNKLLDYNFLICMPNEEDNLSDFYIPIQKSLIHYFNTQSFLITETGAYRSASECFLIKSLEAQNVLIPSVLKNFIEIFEQKEVKNIYYLDRGRVKYRSLRFIKMLDVQIIDNSKLLEYLENLSTLNNDIILDMIESESDKWFKNLYTFLNFQNSSYSSNFKKFILLSTNRLNLKKKNCYFSKTSIKYFPIVKESVYFRNHDAKNFLENKLGVQEIGDKELIEIVLKENYKDSLVSKESHIEHIRKFLTYYQRHKTDIEFFKNYNFIKITESDGYKKPEKIYIDNPFEPTGMKILFKDNGSFFSLNEVYHQLEKDRKKVFLEFLKRLGARAQLVIEKEKSLNIFFHKGRDWINKQKVQRENKYREFIDYKLENDAKIFEIQSIEVSLLIWNTIKNLNEEQLRAYLRFKKSRDPKIDLIDDSTLLYQLKNKAWIPDKDGNFYKSQDIAKEQLHPQFYFSVGNVWLDAIEVGKNIKRDEDEYKKTKQIVEETTGYRLDILEELKRSGITEKDLEHFKTQKLKESLAINQGDGESQKIIQPKNNETTIIDDKKYEENIKEENINNPNTWEDASTSYKRQDTKSIKRIEAFLYREYEGHCQICGDTFAYKDKNTYKTKSLNVGKLRDVNRKGNSLSLCFKHHEIFKRNLQKYSFYDEIKEKDKLSLKFIKGIFAQYDWVGKDDINIKNDTFYMLDEKDEFMRDEVFFLGVKIFGEELFLKFTKAHILEFIEVWNEN